MSIQTRHMAFVYALWDSVLDKIVGISDEQGSPTYFPYWNATQTALLDPTGSPVLSGNVAYNSAIDRANHVGTNTLVVVNKTADFTPTLLESAANGGDNLFLVNSAGAVTVTLPQNSVVGIPVNTHLRLIKVGAGNLVVAAGAGATVISPDSLTVTVLNTRVDCWKIGPNLWHVSHGTTGGAVGTAPTPAPSAQFTTPPVITAGASPLIPGTVLTCSDGTTNVTTTKVKNWWFLDTISGFTGPIIQAGVPVTGNTYTVTDQDIDNTVFVKLDATPAFGAVLSVTVPGLTVVRGSTPAPAPPPTPGQTVGPTITTFTASGNRTATTNEVIQGLSFTGAGGPKITIPQGVTGVTIQNCDFASSNSSCILNQGGSVIIRNCRFRDSWRGILINSGTNTSILYNIFEGASLGTAFEGHAIENDYNSGPTLIDHNTFSGTYPSDCVSNFNTSRVTMTNNSWNVDIQNASGAAFTMGDSLNFTPGSDNYIAFNTIIQTGIGVSSGVFGSDGNTVMEYNCFTNGIQAYNYNGNPFVGVTIRNNVIAPGYFVPDTTVITGWNTNIISTNCALVPTP